MLPTGGIEPLARAVEEGGREGCTCDAHVFQSVAAGTHEKERKRRRKKKEERKGSEKGNFTPLYSRSTGIIFSNDAVVQRFLAAESADGCHHGGKHNAPKCSRGNRDDRGRGIRRKILQSIKRRQLRARSGAHYCDENHAHYIRRSDHRAHQPRQHAFSCGDVRDRRQRKGSSTKVFKIDGREGKELVVFLSCVIDSAPPESFPESQQVAGNVRPGERRRDAQRNSVFETT